MYRIFRNFQTRIFEFAPELTFASQATKLLQIMIIKVYKQYWIISKYILFVNELSLFGFDKIKNTFTTFDFYSKNTVIMGYYNKSTHKFSHVNYPNTGTSLMQTLTDN
jgi:hypothetical protein